MAVTQVSQIQVRYGLQEDIGSLAGGEFAWAIDTQRLFIGNGPVEEGAPIAGITEIMTTNFNFNDILENFQYIYRGTLGGYDVITGPRVEEPVIRRLQDKLDDFVNVRDFGVSSTGNTDETDSLQRALDELYDRKDPVTDQRTRRALRLNGGTYRIDGELKIPPFVSLIGEGKDSVRIILNGPAARLTTTTGGDAGAEITIGIYPTAVSIKSMTIETSDDVDILTIEGSDNIVFEDVAFVGPVLETEPNRTGAAVHIKSTARTTHNIQFHRCTFKGLAYGAYINATTFPINDIVFSGCLFTNLWNGVLSDTPGNTVKNIKVSNSIFKDIFTQAISGSWSTTGIFSMGNSFFNCASMLEGDDAVYDSNSWGPVIFFGTDGNHSIGDYFNRTLDISRNHPRIEASNLSYVSLSMDDCLRLGSAQYFAGRRFTAGNANTFEITIGRFTRGLIDYTVVRDSGISTPPTVDLNTRTGKIIFSANKGDIVWSDDYTETNDCGLLLNLTVDVNLIEGIYTVIMNGVVSDQGTSLDIQYDIKTLE